ncbi:uncharacterized protein EV420DRAFT_1313075 [Desarmillaria tabescens]|uniref:Actin-like ATPase domain-containing protein n=1 Tax=Armillaria tabescens TaxID=1929756 RepID=A0AA39JU51_ARMTA|nr:uncharacterized protein EV420DRAFT_1313075 [Desarmillaria tabescens]KAK0448956.1 hypothetical protein EV420DRAFT_1313075 [Desarmillaria tabescens]
MASRTAYNGSQRKLCIAFDLGTTFSGVSYRQVVLDPGNIPEIIGVTRFPSHEHVGNEAKIPTIIYYDKEGNVRAVGAEALKQNIVEQAEEEGWVKYSEFKLHLRNIVEQVKEEDGKKYLNKLRPQVIDSPQIKTKLPSFKALTQVFADFYAYLFQCTKTFILETHQSAQVFWSSVVDNIEFVLSHPNGWQGAEQAKMRQAMIDARLVPNSDEGHTRVRFVTEGEASLHFCIRHGLASHIKDDEAVIIIDAGGGTVDINAYTSVPSTADGVRSFEEVALPQCHFSGSLFVTRRAHAFIEDKLKGTSFAGEVANIIECFDKSTKLRFRNSDEPAYIKFGSMKDKDLVLNIRAGQLKLAGTDVAGFFEPSIKSIIDIVHQQRCTSRKTVTTVFLVGGFAASDYLFLKLQECLKPLGIAFYRPDGHVNKAVPDGAMSFYVDRAVSMRISQFSYGVRTTDVFNPKDPQHQKRKDKVYTNDTGALVLEDRYVEILGKNVRLAEGTEFRTSFYWTGKSLSTLTSLSIDILSYRGALKHPRWTDVGKSKYEVLCHITANTHEAAKLLKLRKRPDGKTYFKLECEIILSFRDTEMKAQFCWTENGVEKRGPARIVYD